MHHLEELTKKLECVIKEYHCHLPRSDCLTLRRQARGKEQSKSNVNI